MNKRKVSLAIGIALFVTAAAQSAMAAGTPLVLETDQTQIIAVTTDPGTVVVGNPSIADVSVNGKQIFLHGHSFGETNVIVLDINGNQLANFAVTVTHNSDNMVAVFWANPNHGATRYSYSCAPYCDSSMMPGDEHGYFKNLTQDSNDKYSFATGKKAADAAPPAAPQ